MAYNCIIWLHIYSHLGRIMKNRDLMLKQLDRKLEGSNPTKAAYEKPKIGWVRMLRKALGMTAEQLAKRLGLTRARIKQLENAEMKDAVTLHALKSAAEAMNCDFVYAIVPKTSLNNILETQAKKIALNRINNVVHSMSLEDQTTSKEQQQEQLKEIVKDLLEGPPKKLWE